MKVLSFLLLLFLLLSCAKKESGEAMAPPPDCPGAYVILPGNFIIDLAANAEIELNPAVQEFALFCKPQDAANTLAEHRKNMLLPEQGDWKVYKLQGDFQALASPISSGQFCLGQRAMVEDWVEVE